MALLLEQWKPVVGYEDLYEVTNMGRIRGIVAGIVIRQRGGRRESPTVSLSKDAARRHCHVHAIVADAFLEGSPDLTEVVHADGWRINNRVSNLLRLSAQEFSDRQKAARREYARLYFHLNSERIKALAEPRAEERKASQRLYYRRNKQQVVEKIEAYRKQNKDKINTRTRRKRVECAEFAHKEKGWHTKRYTTSRRYRLRVLTTNAKWRSKAAGIEADAACFEAMLAAPPAECSCCGSELDYEGKTARSPSLDRIHNDFGYIVGNVAVICIRCNSLKKNGTVSEFERILAYMRRAEPPAAAATASSLPRAFWKQERGG